MRNKLINNEEKKKIQLLPYFVVHKDILDAKDLINSDKNKDYLNY